MRVLTFVLLLMVGLLMIGPDAPDDKPGDWNSLVRKEIEAYAAVKEPAPTAYPWVARRLKTLFEVKSVGHVQVFREEDSKRTLNMDIYYRAGEVHIIDHDKGWNLVTKGQEAFEWQNGDQEGVITKLTDEDLIAYLIYLTDPSLIMTCMYHEALYESAEFLPPKTLDGGMIERRLKQPREGFRAVFVSDDPAWLCGFECDTDRKGGKPGRILFSKPESLKDVPDAVFERLKGITFEKSDLTIRRHMVFL